MLFFFIVVILCSTAYLTIMQQFTPSCYSTFSTSALLSLRSCPSHRAVHQMLCCISIHRHRRVPTWFFSQRRTNRVWCLFFFLIFFHWLHLSALSYLKEDSLRGWLTFELDGRQQRKISWHLYLMRWRRAQMPFSAQASICTPHQGCFPFN